MDVHSDFTIPSFRRHITILFRKSTLSLGDTNTDRDLIIQVGGWMQG
jgi:hypothetical protein